MNSLYNELTTFSRIFRNNKILSTVHANNIHFHKKIHRFVEKKWFKHVVKRSFVISNSLLLFRDMQEISGATIKVVQRFGICRKNIQISGAPNAIELAEELIMALFKFEDPSEFSDGLKESVIAKLLPLLTPNSVLVTKVLSLYADKYA